MQANYCIPNLRDRPESDSVGWNMVDVLPYNNEAAFINTTMENGVAEPVPWFGDPFSAFVNLDSDMSLTPPLTGSTQSPMTPCFPPNSQSFDNSKGLNTPPNSLGGDAQSASSSFVDAYRIAESRRGSSSQTTQTIQTNLTRSFDPTTQPSPNQQRLAVVPETEEAKTAGSPGRRKRRSTRRRGSSISSEDETGQEMRARQMHTAVERRYRDNLNQKFEQLSKTLKATGTSALPILEDTNRRTRKVDVLADAVGYINRSEVEIRHMSDEIRRLNEQLLQAQSVEHRAGGGQ